MTTLQQPQITSSGPKTDEPSPSKRRPHNHSGSLAPEPVGHRWGLLELIDTAFTRREDYRYVKVRCTGCGMERMTSYDNLRAGKSTRCQSCAGKCGAPVWLIQRMEAARQRCTNPKDRAYSRYGARGIQFCFPSVAAAAVWVMENLGLHRDQEIDRVDNNGNYEPGNIRYASRRVNINNRNSSTILRFHKFRTMYPEVRYADTTLRNMLSHGMTYEEIVSRWEAPSCKPKGVYGTFSTADQDIVSQLTGG